MKEIASIPLRPIGLACAVALLAGAAAAESWRLAEPVSSLTFSYLENGEVIEGAFTEFDGEADFDSADPSGAFVTIDVSTASVSFGDPLRDHFARSVDWFDVENHPEAGFELTRLVALPDGRFSAEGALEIRGIRQTVFATLDIRRAEDALSAAGEMTFPRSAFGVGVGFSGLLADIGDDITVRFDLTGERVE